MKFEFNWRTNNFDDAKKNELEKEIEQKVSKHLKQVVHGEVETMSFSLYECTTKDCLVTGEAICTENGQNRRTIKIKLDQGFLIHCDNSSWFQPRTHFRNQS